ncbi:MULTISPECIES: ABC transporter ATP-binding protein [Streptomyces]|uniref:ABC transporter ATP-binding protein n=2 Tax=Streptomyces TaxID=1883 RepID=A0A0B5F1N1_STRA4|nr:MULTISPECIES: ABC transporter ATP-binding protein [Streptomyces]AJE84237.1 ABC transporter ATP-binding protein [Streptomyces albus]AOU78544.1 ABC transporter ATP-binding protein [Streptomyces albus]AYN34289.1 ABC transporter ATP-binding protein [Streptomyces albus]NKI42411.1 ABC transporter ATP-binding protein [Streptomyces physcomitrii]
MFGKRNRGARAGRAGHPEALRLVKVSKRYGSGAGGGPQDNSVTALDEVTLSLPAGSFTAIMGPSGSGKSTLLQCAAGLDRPDSGLVMVDGEEMTGGSEAELTKFRRSRIGFVFQQYNLLPTLTVAQNTTLPLRLAGRRIDRARTEQVLAQVGLGDRLGHRPDQLSGGQRQRVAIARALVTEPRVVFADEPTGALDMRSAREVLRLLQQAVRVHGRTVVMVTHDPVAASYADSVVFLADGRLAGQLQSPSVDAVAERLAHLGDLAQGGARSPYPAAPGHPAPGTATDHTIRLGA